MTIFDNFSRKKKPGQTPLTHKKRVSQGSIRGLMVEKKRLIQSLKRGLFHKPPTKLTLKKPRREISLTMGHSICNELPQNY